MKIVRLLMMAIIIVLMVAFVFSKNNWDEKIEQHSQQSMDNVAQTKSVEVLGEKEIVQEKESTEEKAEVIEDEEKAASVKSEESEFYNLLLEQKITSIKLLGDGITAGYGHSAYSAPDGGRIIFHGNGETYREAGYEFDSWANQLRNYASKPEFGEVDVINAGIRDKTADWTLRNLDRLLKTKEEAVIVMIGTDDRIFITLEEYEATMRKLLAVADERSESMIVMSPPPSKEDLQPYKFTMKEINEVLKNISEEKGYTFISQFDAFQEQMENGVKYESLMQTATSNPQNDGYELIWQTMKQELDLQ